MSLLDMYQQWTFHAFVQHCFSHSPFHSVTDVSSAVSHVQSPTFSLPLAFPFISSSSLCPYSLFRLSVFLPLSCAMSHRLIFITAALTQPYNESRNWLHIQLRQQWYVLELFQAKHTSVATPDTISVYIGHCFVDVVDRLSALIALSFRNCNMLPNVLISF